MKHAHQPMVTEDKVLRFRRNPLVSYLLEVAPVTLNDLAELPGIEPDDYAHFAQLIGYSVAGWGELDYVGDELWSAAHAAQEISAIVQKEVDRQKALKHCFQSIAALTALRDALQGKECYPHGEVIKSITINTSQPVDGYEHSLMIDVINAARRLVEVETANGVVYGGTGDALVRALEKYDALKGVTP